MRRNIIQWTMTVAMIVFGAGIARADDAATLHIGAAISLSGATGVWGQEFQKGLKLMLERLPDGKLAGHPVKLTVYDTETNSTKTAQLFRRLAESDKVDVIITGSNSGEGLAVVPLANELKVPTINMGAAEAITNPVTPYMFAISPMDRIVVEHLLSVMQAKKFKRVAILSSQDGFGQSGSGIARELASSYGVTLVASETFSPQDTDMTTQLLKVSDAKPDAILIWAGNPGPTIIAKNAKALGIQIPLMVSYAQCAVPVHHADRSSLRRRADIRHEDHRTVLVAGQRPAEEAADRLRRGIPRPNTRLRPIRPPAMQRMQLPC